jgi:hypothetical protein
MLFFNLRIITLDWIYSTSAREHLHLPTLKPKTHNSPKIKKTTHRNTFSSLHSDQHFLLPYSPSPATVNGGDPFKNNENTSTTISQSSPKLSLLSCQPPSQTYSPATFCATGVDLHCRRRYNFVHTNFRIPLRCTSHYKFGFILTGLDLNVE